MNYYDNREAIISALNNLKIKIKELQEERLKAEESLKIIANELNYLRSLNTLKSSYEYIEFTEQSEDIEHDNFSSAKDLTVGLGDNISSLKKVVLSLPNPKCDGCSVNEDKILKSSAWLTGQDTFLGTNSNSNKGIKDEKKSDNFASHYHLNLRHVPFLLSGTTSRSHSLIANIQMLISSLKAHNRLCLLQDKSDDSNGILLKMTTVMQQFEQILNDLQRELSVLKRSLLRAQNEAGRCSSAGRACVEKFKDQINSKQSQIKTLQMFKHEVVDVLNHCKSDGAKSKKLKRIIKAPRNKHSVFPVSTQNIIKQAQTLSSLLNAGNNHCK